MRLFSWLENKVQGEYPWEDYAYSDADIPQMAEDYFLVCQVWDQVNCWVEEYSDQCRGIDAALILRILNSTLELVEERKRKLARGTAGIEGLIAAEELCCLYARACLFAKSSWGGSEYLEKSRLIVNNTISECIIRSKSHAVFADLEKCDPARDEWEEI